MAEDRIVVNTSRLRYPRLYEPLVFKVPPGASPTPAQFGVTICLADLPEEQRPTVKQQFHEDGIFTPIFSNIRPQIVVTGAVGAVSRFHGALQDCDDLNIPRDKLFQGIPARLLVSFREVDNRFWRGTKFTLYAVEIAGEDIERRFKEIIKEASQWFEEEALDTDLSLTN